MTREPELPKLNYEILMRELELTQDSTWEQFKTTTIPLFNNITLEKMIHPEALSRAEKAFKVYDFFKVGDIILDQLGQRTSYLDWTLSPATLSKMSPARFKELRLDAIERAIERRSVTRELSPDAIRKEKESTLAKMQSIKASAVDDRTKREQIINLPFKDSVLGETLYNPATFNIDAWLKSDLDKEAKMNVRLNRLLDGHGVPVRDPLPLRSPVAAAAPAKEDVNDLLTSMRDIKSKKEVDKTRKIMNFKFRGHRLGDLLSDPAKFNVQEWLEAGPDKAHAMEHDLNQILNPIPAEPVLPRSLQKAVESHVHEVKDGRGALTPSSTPQAFRGGGAGHHR